LPRKEQKGCLPLHLSRIGSCDRGKEVNLGRKRGGGEERERNFERPVRELNYGSILAIPGEGEERKRSFCSKEGKGEENGGINGIFWLIAKLHRLQRTLSPGGGKKEEKEENLSGGKEKGKGEGPRLIMPQPLLVVVVLCRFPRDVWGGRNGEGVFRRGEKGGEKKGERRCGLPHLLSTS